MGIAKVTFTRRFLATISFAFITLPSSTYACFSDALKREHVPFEELIANSTNIFLVEAQKAEGASYRMSTTNGTQEFFCQENGRYCHIKLKIIEVLKGAKIDLGIHNGDTPVIPDEDFGKHEVEEFWKERTGRMPLIHTSCGPQAFPAFIPGKQYLYFPDFDYAAKSAEVIKSHDDKWLKYVRERVVEQARVE